MSVVYQIRKLKIAKSFSKLDEKYTFKDPRSSMHVKNRKCEENTPMCCVICNICVRKLYEKNSIKVKVEVYHVITCEGIKSLEGELW